MYQTADVLPELTKYASVFVMENDRSRFRPCFEAIEKNLGDCVIGGNIGADLLMGRPPTRETLTYDLYTDDVWGTAKRIADLLCSVHAPFLDLSTVTAETMVKNIESVVSVELRPIARIYRLPSLRGEKTVDYTECKGGFTGETVKCIEPMVHLMSAYRGLYRPYPPTPHPSYTELLAMEREMSEKIPWLEGEKTGGEESRSDSGESHNESPHDTPDHSGYTTPESLSDDSSSEDLPHTASKTGGRRRSRSRSASPGEHSTRRTVDVTRNAFKSLNTVLIGDLAIGENASHDTSHDSRPQFLYTDDIDDVIGVLKSSFKSSGVHMQLDYTKYDLRIPGDFQTYKYTVYGTDASGRRTSLVDVFNSLQFELVPCIKRDGMSVGITTVLLRFKYIDLYSLRFVSALGGNVQQRTRQLQSQIRGLRAELQRELSVNLQLVFPLSGHLGVYLDESVERKKMVGHERFRFAKYYPCVKREQEGYASD